MAYTYTIFAEAGASIAPSAIPSGTVFQYAGNDYIFVNAYNSQAASNTSSMNFWLQNGFVTHIDGSTTAINDSDAAIYLRSGTADAPPPPPPPTDGETPPPPPPPSSETATVTLTSKTVAGLTKAAQLIGENRTHIKTAESNITGLQTRVTAAEGSIATVNQRISDAETRAKNSAVEQILGGATNAQLDTIKELGDALTNLSGDGVGAINAALAKRVSVDAQTWTSNEQAQARTNIGAASGSDVTNAISAAVGDPSTIDIDAIFTSVGTF